ncbi:LTA synthase family protein [Furfurilactobacillus milii]|uniref:LTA synthase family protein n=1 Tax=Furfurilactobacillus milii TaxID=2888272 RepID=UPI001368DCDD|nr:alkaline phosphatase family protein [Furfurilactobacillus milii]
MIEKLFSAYTGQIFKNIYWIVLISSALFSHDLFSLNYETGVWGALLFFETGNYLRHYGVPTIKKSVIYFCLGFLGEIILNCSMSYISAIVHLNLSSSLRFVNGVNPFMIIAIIALFSIIMQLSHAKVFSDRQGLLNLYLLASGLFGYEMTYRWITEKYLQNVITKHATSLQNWKWYLLYAAIGLTLSCFVALIEVLTVNAPIFNRPQRYFKQLTFSSFLKELTLAKFKKVFKTHFWGILTFVSLYFVSYFSIVIMNPHFTTTTWIVLKPTSAWIAIFFLRQPIVLLNFVFFSAFYLLIRGLTNNFWFSYIITFAVSVLIIVATLIKMSLRNEPILPSEVVMVSGYADILKMVDPIVLISAIVGIIVLIALCVLLNKAVRIKKISMLRRLFYVLGSIVIFSTPLQFNHLGSVPNQISKTVQNAPSFYAQSVGVMLNGPVVQFLNNLDFKVMDKPSNYSKTTIDKIVHKYQKRAIVINKSRTSKLNQQTLIFNLSESFSDPRRVPHMTINENPMPNIDTIKERTTSGLMMSSGYGGGTANMEYQTLTGLSITNFSPTLPIPYTQLVPNAEYAPAITNLFSDSTGIHPYSGDMYDRIADYKKFKFNNFFYLGSKDKIDDQHYIGKNPYLSDETAYENTLQQLSRQKNSQFINLITMQNHMPFNNYYEHNQFKVSGTAFADKTTQEKIENYSKGISYTDSQVKDFITKIDRIQRPITVVWYGDHLPGIYNGLSANTYGQQLHQTDYFVYSNNFARSHGAKRLSYPITAPYEFPALAMEQMNVKVSPFYALETDLLHDTPAMSLSAKTFSTNTDNAAGQFTGSNGHIIPTSQLTHRQRILLHDFELIQYDITAGKHYVRNQNFMK